jgi:hypothetical protein
MKVYRIHAMPLYALTIFTGAFLLFQVQPLIAKYILPWFGGGTGVWTTCMLFFQLLLLGGYAYAHFTSRWLKPRAQVIVHLVLLAAALALLPITPGDHWKPGGGGNPTLQILTLLAASIGLPYLVLSATGPLMQRWFSRTNPGVSPYRLYALSNVGSLLALVTYPVYFETHFTRKTQALLWAGGLVTYALCCALCALKFWQAQPHENSSPASTPHTSPDSIPSPRLTQKILWLLLPACASVLLLATTNKLCRDMVVMPFLWVLPLSLYLLSFIICFDSPRWYVRFPFTLALIAALGGICWTIFRGDGWPVLQIVTMYSGALLICCLVCHGELYRLRPAPRHLTEFYLMIAAGGALGGLFVAVVAPLIFTRYFELHTGVLLCGLLFLVVCVCDRSTDKLKEWRWLAWTLPLAILGGFDWLLAGVSTSETDLRPYLTGIRIGMWTALALLLVAVWVFRKRFQRFQNWRAVACLWLTFGVLALATSLWVTRERPLEAILDTSRNFYGVIRVFEAGKDRPKANFLGLLHERVSHGWQFVDPLQASWPTLYYGEQSGIGLALQALPAKDRRIGVVGLGIGTLAAYGRAGDSMRIYEINPEVERLARSRFTHLAKYPGKVEVVLGDARLSLEREPTQQFDLLALDAFSGDAIPVHLLTKEAFQLYDRHLRTNGIIAVHITNIYLDLEPVIVNLAHQFNYQFAAIYCNGTPEQWWIKPSRWILLTRNEEIINSPAIREATSAVKTSNLDVPLWTDDFASLFQILR